MTSRKRRVNRRFTLIYASRKQDSNRRLCYYNFMKKAGEVYNNCQVVSEQKGDILTYYFKNGDIKAIATAV